MSSLLSSLSPTRTNSKPILPPCPYSPPTLREAHTHSSAHPSVPPPRANSNHGQKHLKYQNRYNRFSRFSRYDRFSRFSRFNAYVLVLPCASRVAGKSVSSDGIDRTVQGKPDEGSYGSMKETKSRAQLDSAAETTWWWSLGFSRLGVDIIIRERDNSSIDDLSDSFQHFLQAPGFATRHPPHPPCCACEFCADPWLT